MSFRDNLQHLRATRNMTQEQLAMLVGVSRQSVTKWEAERAYPEMDKLLKLCQIFDCTLDDLVQGDLTARAAQPELAVPATALAQDVTRTEDKNTVTLVEETQTPDGKIVTTTVYQKNSVFTNGFWHNWTLSLGLGTQLYYGENDWKVAKKTEMLTFPAIDLYLTKWASPSFGVGLGANWAPFKGLYQSNPNYQNGARNITANYIPDKV
jgi:DNA-binding XRE family transcriptional regulator